MPKQGEKVTIKSIAEELGVSFSTVAKALNDDPRISDQTKALVKKKAQEMHYVRNYFAQNLRHQESYTIAIILSDIDIPVYAEMITRLSSDLSRHGYTTIVSAPHCSEEAERNCIQSVLSRMPKAVIISPANPASKNVRLLESMYGNTLILGEPCENVNANFLSLGHRHAGYLNAKHLLENGRHRNLILCGLQEYQSSQLFYQGVQDAYAEFELTIDPSLVSWFRPGEQAGCQRVTEVWEANPGSFDGVICFCDTLAFGVYRAAKKLGLSVPEDLSVVGYDDNPFNDFANPPLTSIRQPKDLLTQYCLEFALKCLQNEDSPPQIWQLEPMLARRESVCEKQ
ncbi:MAG: LacI family DNA-binding transcriptional regulator [Oscillospiraceae bacterium]|nr:LacI family DNA-binding transcriptional regulator [Oscillospiraceae bacterium]